MEEQNQKVTLKILGERNSGTNFLHSFLDTNFDAQIFPNEGHLRRWQRRYLSRFDRRPLRRSIREAMLDENHLLAIPENGGWKHAAATNLFLTDFAQPQGCHVICLTRHPASWLYSMQRNPFHRMTPTPSDFSEFIRSPWVARSRDMLSTRFLDNPIQLLAEKLNSYHWLSTQYSRTHIVRYEDIVLDPDRIAERLSVFLKRKSRHVEVRQESARHFGTGHTTFPEYATKTQQASFNLLNEADREFVQSQLSDCSLARMYPT